MVVPLHTSSLLFLVGGGRSPRYPPNKAILWDDALGREVAELEFRERVRGLACRRGWLAVALRRRIVVFRLGTEISRYGEWDTCDNPRGELYFLIMRNSVPMRYIRSRTDRPACHRNRYTFNPARYTWPSNGACTACAPAAMPASRVIGSAIVITAWTTSTSSHEASSVYHSGPYYSFKYSVRAAVRSFPCDNF